ncbi:MAG TPA: diacylglycerol kinase family protein [Nocardioidaceae bacterium]|nr:diacylglycerol kinase family protein [Nocardioidaceae bacterium]
MRSFHCIVNPVSGGGRAPASVVPLARLLRDAGAAVEVSYSPGPRGCARLVRDAVGAGAVVVAVGGDGMVSSLAGAVVEARGTLAVSPSGRGNDFARALGCPSAAEALAEMLLHAPARSVDVIEVTGPHVGARTVVGSVYAGVDSRASELVDRAHRLPGALQYPYAAVRALLEHRPADYDVLVDGESHTFRAATVVVAGSAYYGSGMRIAPSAVLDDGLLDVVVIRAASRRALLRSLPRLYDGSHVELDEVVVLRGREVSVGTSDPVLGYGDGERLGPLPVTARVRPSALQVLAPEPQ